MTLAEELEKRILVLDGGMGTEILDSGLKYDGNNDVLPLTDPEPVIRIHKAYIDAGADIISTCSFGANSVSQEAYGMQDKVRELNISAAMAARRAADSDPDRKVWVMGSIGPTAKSVTASTLGSTPFEAITFEALKQAYTTQVTALADGGVDGFLVETVTDIRNAEAALQAIREVMSGRGLKLPVMVSGTLSKDGGRLVTGSTIQEFVTTVQSYNPLSVGLNCCFGAKGIVPYVREVASIARCAVSVHPSAGLPTAHGYEERPSDTARVIAGMADEGLINIAGGCCGTTPAHIAAIAACLRNVAPRHFSQ